MLRANGRQRLRLDKLHKACDLKALLAFISNFLPACVHTAICRCGLHLVCDDLQVEARLDEEFVEEVDDLHGELILTEIVANLEQCQCWRDQLAG